jgi:predicted transcriptional regulator
MATKKEIDPLKEFRKQVKDLATEKYRSLDDFCLNGADIPKSTLSRLLSGERTEFRFATLQKIAKGLNKKLVIRLE